MADRINTYPTPGTVRVELLGRGFVGVNTGRSQSLLKARTFVETIKGGVEGACIEEVAYHLGYFSVDQYTPWSHR